MTTLVKCQFCLRNGSTYVEIPSGQPVRCSFCGRVQPVKELASVLIESKKTEPMSTRFTPPSSGSFFA